MYLYHADALALGGNLDRPLQSVVSSQAACSLPPSGGVSSSRVEKFSMNGLVSFDSAQSDLAGGIEIRKGTQFHVTRVSVVVEGLNVLNMVMADRIVIRMTSEHGPNDTEPKITTTGCHYDGLRIAGHPVEIETSHNLFSDMPTFADWQKAWKGKWTRKRVQDCMIGSTLPSTPSKTDPQHLKDVHRAVSEQGEAANLKQTVLSSFVSKVTGITGSKINNWGPIIVVPHFGTIYLGEVIVSYASRRVNMLRLELGESDEGGFVVGSVESSGSIYPVPIVHAGENMRANFSNARYTALKTRYQSLIDRKYMSGLSPAENEELNRLEHDLDELDEPYYENALRRLQEGTPS